MGYNPATCTEQQKLYLERGLGKPWSEIQHMSEYEIQQGLLDPTFRDNHDDTITVEPERSIPTIGQRLGNITESHRSGESDWRRTAAEIVIPLGVWYEFGFLWGIAALIACVAIDVVWAKLEGSR